MSIPAAGPWSRDHSNHPASVTAGFIGTADCISKARAWLSRAAQGVDGDDDHPFCGFQPSGPFASQLRTNGPEAMITANEIRDLTADKLRRLDGLKHLLNLIDNRLAKLASQDDELANPKVATAMATGDVAAIFQALRRYRGLSPGLSMRASPRRFRKSSTSSEDSGRITAVLR